MARRISASRPSPISPMTRKDRSPAIWGIDDGRPGIWSGPKDPQRTAPYLPGSVDMMAVGNLPNELPRDASRYFGEQLIKYVLEDLVRGGSPIIERATMVREGELTEPFSTCEYARWVTSVRRYPRGVFRNTNNNLSSAPRNLRYKLRFHSVWSAR